MSKSRQIRKGRHCVYDIHAHLVFVTKYRYDVLEKPMLATLEILFSSLCADFEAALIEMHGNSDDVYLWVAYPPKVALSKLINSLKHIKNQQAPA